MFIKFKKLPRHLKVIDRANEVKEAKKARPKKLHKARAWSNKQFDGKAQVYFYCAEKLVSKATVIEVEAKEVTVIKCL